METRTARSASKNPRTTKATTTKRAVIYLRQSLDATGEGEAVSRQRKDCLRLAAERGWRVVAEFTDNDVSASGKRRRPQFEEMLTAARAGEFDVIVGWHLDRLTRTLRDLLPLMELGEKYGVKVVTVSGDLDMTTDAGQTVAGLLAVVANGEIKRKGARQSSANQARAEKGRPAMGGRAPLGFQDVMQPDEEGKLRRMRVLNPETAEVVRQAYADLLAGRSLRSITADINAAGYRSLKGTPFGRDAISKMLRAPRYAGLREYKGEIVGAAEWPAIVDEGTWRAAQAILADPARRTNSGYVGGTRRWLGSGIYLCGLCGDGGRIGSNYRESNIDEGPVRTYFCEPGKKHLSRRADIVDEYVVDALLKRLARKDAVKLLRDNDRPDITKLTREAENLRGKLDGLAVQFGNDEITKAQLTTISKTLKARLKTAEAAMAHHSRASVLAEIVTSDDVHKVWESYDVDRKRAILRAVATVTLHKGRPGGNSWHGRRPLQPGTVVIDFLA